jgi:hypothetical protein
MAANRDVADEEIEEEEEAPRRRSNVLRLILLLLLVLVGLCVLCFLASRFMGGVLPIPSIPGIPTTEPTTVPIGETPTETPTPILGEPSPEPTTPPAPPTEQPIPTEEPATEQPQPTEEPATEEPATATPTSPLIDEHGGEIPPEGTETPTTVPVPGPTATPTFGPTVAPTDQANCANNQPPVADAGGPYNAMMGKGQAFVIFDGSSSSDADGTITSYEWDFGDGNTDSGQSVTYGYSSTGTFVASLTVTDNCGATAIDQAEVTIVGPTPPSSSTPQP